MIVIALLAEGGKDRVNDGLPLEVVSFASSNS